MSRRLGEFEILLALVDEEYFLSFIWTYITLG